MYRIPIHFAWKLALYNDLGRTQAGRQADWNTLLPGLALVGEIRETETSTCMQNTGQIGRRAELVRETDISLPGEDTLAVFGHRFPLLTRLIDANNAKRSRQVYLDDYYPACQQQGKAGKAGFWYILDAAPASTIVYGFIVASTQER